MSVPMILEQMDGDLQITSVRFKWADSAQGVEHLDADQCGRQLLDIYRRHGILDPKTVLDDVRNSPGTPLHSALEWDDAVAAEKFRMEQCSNIIRWMECRVTFIKPHECTPREVKIRAFPAVSRGKAVKALSSPGESYVPSFMTSNDNVSRMIRILIHDEIPDPNLSALDESERRYTYIPAPVILENKKLSVNYIEQLLDDISRLVRRYADFVELAGEHRQTLQVLLDELVDLQLRWRHSSK